jgi:hypothetical protein
MLRCLSNRGEVHFTGADINPAMRWVGRRWLRLIAASNSSQAPTSSPQTASSEAGVPPRAGVNRDSRRPFETGPDLTARRSQCPAANEETRGWRSTSEAVLGRPSPTASGRNALPPVDLGAPALTVRLPPANVGARRVPQRARKPQSACTSRCNRTQVRERRIPGFEDRPRPSPGLPSTCRSPDRRLLRAPGHAKGQVADNARPPLPAPRSRSSSHHRRGRSIRHRPSQAAGHRHPNLASEPCQPGHSGHDPKRDRARACGTD